MDDLSIASYDGFGADDDTTTADTRSASHSTDNDTVLLDVGGRRFRAPRSAIESLPKGSPLQSLLASAGAPRSRGALFVDRDWRHFHHVLSFLQVGADRFQPPRSTIARRELYREARFYGVDGLALALKDAYQGAPAPPNEAERLAKVEGLGLMHTGPEARFDGITRLIAGVLDMPVAVLTLVGRDTAWFKSRCGIDAVHWPRRMAFCGYALLPSVDEGGRSPMVVIEDTAEDPRTSENPLVIGERFRFYSGCPLVTSDGAALGTLCVLDRTPRKLESWQVQFQANLAQVVTEELQRAELLAEAPDSGSEDTSEELQEAELLVDAVDSESSEDVHWGLNSSNSDTDYRPASRRSSIAPAPKDFDSGSLRTYRMRQALEEMLCVVQVGSASREWPIVWANSQWSALTGVDAALAEPGLAAAGPPFWDIFRPAAGSVAGLLDQVRDAWATLCKPHTFGLEVELEADGEKTSVQCRFVPAGQPMDLATARVQLPHLSRRADDVRRDKLAERSYLYFVVMAAFDPRHDSLFGG